MKNKSFVFIMLISIVFLFSCKQEPAQMLIGTWKLSKIESSAPMDNVAKQMFAEANKELIEKSTYTFSPEKLILQFDNEKTEATWQLSEDGKTLQVSLSDGKMFSYSISEISDKKIVWSEKFDDGYVVTTTLEKTE
jgi:hypothetical protein